MSATGKNDPIEKQTLGLVLEEFTQEQKTTNPAINDLSKKKSWEKATFIVCRDDYIKKDEWLKCLESQKITCGIK